MPLILGLMSKLNVECCDGSISQAAGVFHFNLTGRPKSASPSCGSLRATTYAKRPKVARQPPLNDPLL